MICIPISGATNDTMRALIAQAEKEPADCYEYRLDSLKEPPEVEALLAAASRPVMATCRSVNEGGSYRGEAADRRAILRRAGMAGAAYIDAEAGDIDSLAECGQAIRIVSLHDFDGTPPDLDARIAALSSTSADWVKFAVTARTHADNLTLFRSLAKCPKPSIAIAMGDVGVVSRILGLRFGSRLTFGSLGAGLESAPGQTTATELADLYRIKSITEKTSLLGYLGHPDFPMTGHVVYNHAFRNNGMDAVCIPFLARDAGEFLDSIPDGLGLCRVVIDPCYERAALAWAASATPEASRAGRANVLSRVDGEWQARYASTSESAVIREMAVCGRTR